MTTRLRTTVLVLAGLLLLGAVGLLGATLLRGGDDVSGLPVNTAGPDDASPSTTPSAQPTSKPSPKPAATCEDDETRFNVEGRPQDTLLPDCGVPAAVTHVEQKAKGLGLACGGSFPTILYKTTTTNAKTSICGRDPSGASFRFVVKVGDGKVLDLPGDYDPWADAFVGRDGGTTYTILGVDGTLVITKPDGSQTSQASEEWISLDNESDYD